MLKDITIGQYYPTGSAIHKLDPRVKLFGTILYIVTLFIARNPVVYILAAAFLFTCIGIAKVPLKYILRGLKTIMIILAFSLIFNIFFTEGRVLVQFWKIKITYEGIIQAIYMGIRLILLIIGSSLMTLTTTPNDLTDGMEKGLRFLTVIKIPVHEIAMMMTIALRFIPTLIEETDKIMNAQKARGADLESGGLVQRAKALIPILIPLFVSAFRRADELALAMECRCYRGSVGRTRLKQLEYSSRDFVALAFMLLCLGAGVDYTAALKIVNSALLVKSGEESLSTIDITAINLYTGQARFYKAGAAPTFVRRGKRTGLVESTSLPAGILTAVEFEQSSVKLSDGDLVVMVSDGATASDSDWILSVVEHFPQDGNLQALCDDIASTARLRRSDNHDDDITVCACRVKQVD